MLNSLRVKIHPGDMNCLLLRSFRHLVKFCYGFVSSKDTQHINGITLLTSEWPLGQMFRP